MGCAYSANEQAVNRRVSRRTKYKTIDSRKKSTMIAGDIVENIIVLE